MTHTLLITNDFPPRTGGIETFCHELARRMSPAADGAPGVVVYTSHASGASEYDAALPFPVVRDTARTLLPTARVARRAAQLVREFGCDRVVFGAAAPLGLLAPHLRAAGARRIVAITHGHELWWARLPGSRQLLRWIADGVDVLTYLNAHTRGVIEPALAPAGRARLAQLSPGVDPALFRPDVDTGAIRQRYRLYGARMVLCATRLVPRKGVDTLLRAWPRVHSAIPDARLLVVGDGPDRTRLHRLRRRLGDAATTVTFAGSHPHAALPEFFAAADVFAMPCRTRRAGLEPEGLGIVYLEAAASGLPVIVGDSGGAPEAVRDGETGYVVNGRDSREVAQRLITLLTTPAQKQAMGERGRRWVRVEWTWDAVASRLESLCPPG
ncbi:glycosyltransferase family 4 protein [Lipingzhangella sp. LS1_29]|uniref:Glycosyltransferase family 4 protein n=1 Tax=Lipingzhangella rawalii TaxID=2055835 RepID=A0ABU2H0Y3_9ACTN|nr:glycosyltransferase family 4 protein [Lipingzhangella rawalii]MDS1268963.1 glycosyltransferase family 4 protein [Lipingzhangella rawalii]